MPRKVPFSEGDARSALAHATCWSDALRLLGYEPKGSNYQTLRRWARHWKISTDHFDPNAGRRRAGAVRRTPLEHILVENSTYPRGHLKRRLLAAGVKQQVCELCGRASCGRPTDVARPRPHKRSCERPPAPKICGWYARTAPRLSTLTVVETSRVNAFVLVAGRPLYPTIYATATARKAAGERSRRGYTEALPILRPQGRTPRLRAAEGRPRIK
jgi:hypothetical protein